MTDMISEKERRYQEEIDAAVKWYRTEDGRKMELTEADKINALRFSKLSRKEQSFILDRFIEENYCKAPRPSYWKMKVLDRELPVEAMWANYKDVVSKIDIEVVLEEYRKMEG